MGWEYCPDFWTQIRFVQKNNEKLKQSYLNTPQSGAYKSLASSLVHIANCLYSERLDEYIGQLIVRVYK